MFYESATSGVPEDAQELAYTITTLAVQYMSQDNRHRLMTLAGMHTEEMRQFHSVQEYIWAVEQLGELNLTETKLHQLRLDVMLEPTS